MLFYKVLFSNLGLAILGLTGFIRLLLFPLTLPALRMSQKQKDLKPELDKLKSRFGDDKDKLARKQLELMQEHGVNPALGCLPQIVQIIVLIALYQVFRQVLQVDEQGISALNNMLYFDFLEIPASGSINVDFLHLDLTQPDPYYILPILAGLAQAGLFFIGRRLQRGQSFSAEESDEGGAKKKEEGGMESMMQDMQSQMGLIFPLMTVFIGVRLQSGLVLYWVASVLLSLVQQWWVLSKE
ncbi:MAG: YidC/Oxa1 family membrane protein insertase [Patescibacteria group bacterium]|nr:YidC/Oxa1 family membrane protein insertase [Patescibacteria group bacterium]